MPVLNQPSPEGPPDILSLISADGVQRVQHCLRPLQEAQQVIQGCVAKALGGSYQITWNESDRLRLTLSNGMGSIHAVFTEIAQIACDVKGF